ncbi:hypothetical protein [Streptomyces cacaoi]|uniref:Uncharacterized protein n=1 Tax=Streptomyces cacaoi TaxID=1898 RepID=A0A4Y3QYC1_STRCI|nr:hypothetical protein [Streptomyces cacaoi]GEB50415.1 hypothetical protein SCA03_29660 [Streptomyces cacaoi]
MATDYVSIVHELLAVYRTLREKRDAVLDGYRDKNGEVPPDTHSAYEKARTDMALADSDFLAGAMDYLTEQFGPPLPGDTYTVTYAGPERHDGEQPYAWVVNGHDLADARANLSRLPTFREWFEDQCAWSSGDEAEGAPDICFLAKESHPGVPEWGYYNDLRREQSAELRRQQAEPRAERPAVQQLLAQGA